MYVGYAQRGYHCLSSFLLPKKGGGKLYYTRVLDTELELSAPALIHDTGMKPIVTYIYPRRVTACHGYMTNAPAYEAWIARSQQQFYSEKRYARLSYAFKNK